MEGTVDRGRTDAICVETPARSLKRDYYACRYCQNDTEQLVYGKPFTKQQCTKHRSKDRSEG